MFILLFIIITILVSGAPYSPVTEFTAYVLSQESDRSLLLLQFKLHCRIEMF